MNYVYWGTKHLSRPKFVHSLARRAPHCFVPFGDGDSTSIHRTSDECRRDVHTTHACGSTLRQRAVDGRRRSSCPRRDARAVLHLGLGQSQEPARRDDGWRKRRGSRLPRVTAGRRGTGTALEQLRPQLLRRRLREWSPTWRPWQAPHQVDR